MAELGHSKLIPLLLLLLLLLVKSGSGYDECAEMSCGTYEPPVRFPFQLVKLPNDPCAFPEFCLYCSDDDHKKTILSLPTTIGPIKFVVVDIHYKPQSILLTDPEYCLSMKFLKLNSSSFLTYQFYSVPVINITFLNCSSITHRYLGRQDMIKCPIYVSDLYSSVLELSLESCTKMFDVTASASLKDLPGNVLNLSWPKPDCTECKAKGKKCRWNHNSTKGDIECFDCINIKERRSIHIPKFLIFVATGSILLGLLIIAIIKIYLYFREKEEDQVRVDKFLEDYRAQQPTRFSYADIKRITSRFKEKLGEGAHGKVFKGKLSNEILVAVKILNNTEGEGKEFITEVGIMGQIHHINVVRLLGFCAEGFHRALVYNLFPEGSLQSFIFPPDDKDRFMGWEKLLQIGIGIARGIEYLHDGCNHSILHFDINPHNVLLDESFTPKISDFGLAKLCPKNRSAVSMTAARGTLGYMAPEVLSRNFGNVSLKSDIYSYGMLLLEMVGGKKNIDISSPENFRVLYPDWIHNLLKGDIHINIDDECGFKIAKKLAIVGLWCIQWQPVNRPSIKSVIQMLETGQDSRLNVPPNPFHSTTSITTSESTLPRRPFQMEVIQE